MRSITTRAVALSSLAVVLGAVAVTGSAVASTPASTTLRPASDGDTSSVTWTGGPYTGAVLAPESCTATTCDTHSVTLEIPEGYWDSHDGGVEIAITWGSSSEDYDLYVDDASGRQIGSSAAGATTSESVDLGTLEPGRYTVRVVPYTTAGSSYEGTATLTGTAIPTSMKYPESRKAVEDELVVDYPLNIVFVGRKPTAAEVAELKQWTPAKYRPTVSTKTSASGETTQIGAGLLNWNKDHFDGAPYFQGITYNYKINVLAASDEYTKALFQVAEDATAQGQTYHAGAGSTRTANQVKYDAAFGNHRVLAKGGDASYKVTDPTKTDLVDAYAVEDWIFQTRYDATWSCAYTNLETGACVAPSVVNPDQGAYHDPYYDKNGLDLDRMPQGPNQGSSFFFLDTFTPEYAKDYFRPNAYHTYGTDKVIDGAIVPKPVEEGGSWRITDPDTGDWDGIDYARTWGGRYRFHFIDLGAAPNDFEAATWAGRGLGMSSDYPHGDPPVWQYASDPLWRQSGDSCKTDGTPVAGMDLPYNNNTPCRMMPRLARDVAYGLFFRSTAGFLYRPIPRGDTYWLAVSNWTDFYSRPQWVNGQLTNAPYYGTWWTDMDKLYKIGDVAGGTQQDDTLRWLSSATPYARWVGRKNETIPLYDPTNNQPTGEVLDTSPKYADLPAPSHHVQTKDGGATRVPEPLHDGHHDHAHYGDKSVDLTAVQEALEKAKATGSGLGPGYDGAVSHESFRDFIDANPDGIADRVEGVNTIPAINVVFEKTLTWALPAIVGGIAVGTADGEAWGVMNNVNDRFKSSASHYPGVQPGDAPGSKRSMTDASLPTQDSGGGFSYTIEHEAAHNLGLSHPHDGSYGVDRCPAGHPQAGQWECYWQGLGWMYDVSAAPTTYAMSYRPYEVEDQDQLQRGHTAEYLIGAQDALRQRLADEATAGRTTPSSGWTSDFDRMRTWRTQAGELFRKGDYLHAEYAARNAALAARGVPQTAANTSAPKLVEAGQVFYFTVNPQGDGRPAAKPNLKPTTITAAQPERKQTTVSVEVSNTGTAAASGVTVELFDGTTSLGTTSPVNLAAGATATVTRVWDTRAVKGDRTLKAVVDPGNTVAETSETDNTLTRTVSIKGNRVENGSYEVSASGTAPDGWTASGGTTYDTSGAYATDGTDAVGLTGGLTPGSWASGPVEVAAGQAYAVAMSAAGGVPALSATFLDSTGKVVSKIASVDLVVSKIDSSVSKIDAGVSKIDGVVSKISGTVTVPAGASRVVLTAKAPTTLPAGATLWLDDVWLW